MRGRAVQRGEGDSAQVCSGENSAVSFEGGGGTRLSLTPAGTVM